MKKRPGKQVGRDPPRSEQIEPWSDPEFDPQDVPEWDPGDPPGIDPADSPMNHPWSSKAERIEAVCRMWGRFWSRRGPAV
jgi:hypothetical protein